MRKLIYIFTIVCAVQFTYAGGGYNWHLDINEPLNPGDTFSLVLQSNSGYDLWEGFISCPVEATQIVEFDTDTSPYVLQTSNFFDNPTTSSWGYNWLMTNSDIPVPYVPDQDWLKMDFQYSGGVLEFRAYDVGIMSRTHTLDQIIIVPEPCSLVLLSLGGLILRRKYRR